MKTAFIIGIGNRHRGDDAAGLRVMDLLKADFATLEHDGEPASLIDAMQGHDRVILVDAVSSGAAAGEIFRLDLQKEGLPGAFTQTSTHSFGIVEAVELARALGKLPPALVFYGIEGKNLAVGDGISPEVQNATETVAASIRAETQEKKHA